MGEGLLEDYIAATREILIPEIINWVYAQNSFFAYLKGKAR